MTDHKALPTQEIGSLPKFSWRTKPFRQQPLEEGDIAVARAWGRRLGVKNLDSLLRLLKKRNGFTDEEKRRIVEFSMLYAIAMQEKAGEHLREPGLDLVWSGEQARTEMYETPVSNIEGFEFLGRVRSFDNKYCRDPVPDGRRRQARRRVVQRNDKGSRWNLQPSQLLSSQVRLRDSLSSPSRGEELQQVLV